MYIDQTIQNGYNPCLTTENDAGTELTAGVLSLEAGERFTFSDPDRETAVLLLQGCALFGWGGEQRTAHRPDSFHHHPWCLHLCRSTQGAVEALEHSEFYVQTAENPRDFPAKLYTPDNVQVQHAGADGELQGCMRREVKTLQRNTSGKSPEEIVMFSFCVYWVLPSSIQS